VQFDEIAETQKVTPGEYVLHEPTKQIVMCGAFNREKDFIRAIGMGRSLEDKISNFKKIRLTEEEQQDRRVSKCKGCG
jgi:hypothetical protein